MIKKIFATVSTLFLASSVVQAKSQIVSDSFISATTKQEVKMEVYLPDGYEAGKQKYPVIYMLHGAGGNETDWRVKGGIQYTADALIARQKMRPSIIVMPTLGPQSWWANGNETNAEDAFLKDLIPYVEQKYAVNKDRQSRSVAGLSMGGYGALNLSMSHPELFCSAGIISPAIYDPFPPATSASRKAKQLMKEGKFDEATWTKLLYVSRLNGYKSANKIVPMFIMSGDHDVFNIVNAAAKLFWSLHEMQPDDVEYRVIDGDHDWLVFRESSVPTLQYMSEKCLAK